MRIDDWDGIRQIEVELEWQLGKHLVHLGRCLSHSGILVVGGDVRLIVPRVAIQGSRCLHFRRLLVCVDSVRGVQDARLILLLLRHGIGEVAIEDLVLLVVLKLGQVVLVLGAQVS